MKSINHIPLTYQMYFNEPASRRFSSMEENKTLESIFDYLSKSEQVNKMIDSTALLRPALEGVIEEMEILFPINAEFNLDDNNRHRQIIGSMTRYIMGFYGYRPGKAKKMRKGQFIGGAIVYSKYS